MNWVAEGMVVYRPDVRTVVRARRIGEAPTGVCTERVVVHVPQMRGVVLVAAGNDARIQFDDGTEGWWRVDDLLSEAQVAFDAARRLGAE